MDLSSELKKSEIDPKAIGQYLDRLAPSERLQETRRLSPRSQAALFDAVSGARALSLEDFVPNGTPARSEVAHLGKNSLPAFKLFAKVFCRAEPGAPELWGYNRCSDFIQTCVGPGYYVAYPGARGEVLVDYTLEPPDKPEHWPKILPNEARMGRFVYAGMVDVLRGVSRHVSVGRAVRKGKLVDNWFVLCREEG